MSILPILTLPDTRLKTVAVPVTEFDQSLEKLASDMLETMYLAPGIGLAATQVDQHIQLVVIDVSEAKNDPLVLVNPKITAQDGHQIHEEGCLSVPGIYASVKRADQIEVEYQDVKGQKHHMFADGLLAVCVQHELDHLDGKRKLAIKKLQKELAT